MTKFSEYQQLVEHTRIYPTEHAVIYPLLGLAGETGEVCEKVKKSLRGDNQLDIEALKRELGDVLWYLTAASIDLGFNLEDVVNENMKKLLKRKEKGLIHGDGDYRESKAS